MTLKELTIKRGLRAENALRYIVEVCDTDGITSAEIVDRVLQVVNNSLNDITQMIAEFEESNNVHKPNED